MKTYSATLNFLVEDFEKRAKGLRADRNLHTFVMKTVEPRTTIISAVGRILRSIERHATLVETAISIGRMIQQKNRLERSSVAACHLGWFVMVGFVEAGILDFGLTSGKKRQKKYQHYQLTVKRLGALEALWNDVKDEDVDLFPQGQPTGTWAGPKHSLGYGIIKKAEPETLALFSPERQPLVFKALNKLGNQGYRVNPLVFEVASFFQEAEGGPFDFSGELDRQKRMSKELEVGYTLRLAKNNLGSVFYHLYNCDFRGRIYTNTAYLNEQASDLAKGLILLDQGDRLGAQGLFWLKVFIANCAGQDKLPPKDRAAWTEENLGLLLDFARNPVTNTGWLSLEKPWSALAGCFELLSIFEYWNGPVEDYYCRLPIYIDGTVSGTQHLVALSKDEELAPMVNLVESERIGDLYSFLAVKLWSRIDAMTAKLDQGTLKLLDEVLDKVTELQHAYDSAPYGSEQKFQAYQALSEWRNQNRALRELLFPAFWSRVTDKRQRRKLTKRGVMTLGYGATRYGFSQQIIDDSPGISSYIDKAERLWCAQLGALLFDVCYEELEGPASMLRLFGSLAERASEKEAYLSWTVPVTGFRVIQHYRKPKIQRTKLTYAGQELKVNLAAWEEATLDAKAQKDGASPNIVHSLDAAHLTSVVASTEYSTVVIHDSFGCSPGNMEHLFHHVRQKFVELYKTDPLAAILSQLDSMDLLPKRGQYDVSAILNSQYAFS